MFRFSLAPVLDYREALEQKRQREYAHAMDMLQVIEDEKRQTLVKIDESHTKAGDAIREGRTDGEAALHQRWIQWAESDLPRVDREIAGRRAEVEARRQRLIETVRERQVIEKLREIENREYVKQADRAEQQMFDEIALREFYSQRRKGAEKVAQAEERNSQ